MKRTVDIGSPEPDSEEPAAGSVDIAVSALLTPDLQQRFAGLRFNSETATPPAYVLAKNTYVLIDPDLRKAMDVVRQKRKGSESEKRDFIRNPRAAVCQAMGLEGGSPLAAALFIETKQYSERVIGLGIWAKPTLPFLSRICENWLPETFSVSIGGKPVAVTRGEIERLAADVDDAVASGVDTVLFKGKELSRNDAKVIVEDALKLAALEGDGVGEVAENDGTAAKASKEGEQRSEKLVLVATTNFDGVEYEQQRKKREAYISRSIPGERLGAVTLKPHQDVGFNWLLEGWCSELAPVV